MKERDLYPIFQKKMKKADPSAFCYKIPDYKGGGKRPFDFILVVEGIPFALEFKSRGKEVTPYQKHQLETFKIAGGIPMVYTEGENMDNFIISIFSTVKFIKNKI